MNKWFLRENSRRFFRIDMPMQVFVTPSSPINNLEIYATGIDYFPPIINKLIGIQLADTSYWSNKIQEQKDLLLPLFNEISDSIEFFGKGVVQLSQGLSPKNDPSFWLLMNEKLHGFKSLTILKTKAPKTHSYFKQIEDKYLHYLNSFFESIKESTAEEFSANPGLLDAFKIDETTERFSNTKLNNIPLIQAIIAITSYMNTYLNAYKQINDDNAIRKFPLKWPVMDANISASGIALLFSKRFKKRDKVDVFIYFTENKKIIKFDGSIVNLRSLEMEYKERVAINFDFPDGSSQDFLMHKIQEYELNLCEDLKF